MGVYIPNLEKPSSCCALLADGSIYDCIYLTSEMSCKLQPESKPYNWDETYETCPMIEIDDNTIYKLYKSFINKEDLEDNEINRAILTGYIDAKLAEKMNNMLWEYICYGTISEDVGEIKNLEEFK